MRQGSDNIRHLYYVADALSRFCKRTQERHPYLPYIILVLYQLFELAVDVAYRLKFAST